ncbi:MAG TPA: MBL fold metallo-hydrolase [Hyphomicrobiaceae bacterium]|nr:MBL fold metallo-hydrolase [Hyphomicrobiaceae bacterium]
MIRTRKIGDATVTSVIEYSGPTHAPEFLFEKDLDRARLKANERWLAPNHYVPKMDRFIITIQLWILKAGGNTIIVDTGVGNLKPRAAERMNMLNTLVLPWLEAAGAGPNEVTHVVHTHMHTDHVGWDTTLKAGTWTPTFPKARYLYPKRDFDDLASAAKAGKPDPAFADSVMPVVEAGLADMIDPEKEAAGCLAVEPAPGHSHGMVTFRLRSRAEEAIFSADVMHHPIQVAEPSWNSRYCVAPDQARKTRAELLARAADRNALIMPMHFGAPYCGYIRRQGSGYRFEGAGW